VSNTARSIGMKTLTNHPSNSTHIHALCSELSCRSAPPQADFTQSEVRGLGLVGWGVQLVSLLGKLNIMGSAPARLSESLLAKAPSPSTHRVCGGHLERLRR